MRQILEPSVEERSRVRICCIHGAYELDDYGIAHEGLVYPYGYGESVTS